MGITDDEDVDLFVALVGGLADSQMGQRPGRHPLRPAARPRRVDTARATGCDLVPTAEHDGAIVADVVAEWDGRHGQAYALTLTGPAGGRWTAGSGGPELELDAVELCRVLSGSGCGHGEGLLGVEVPF